MMMVCKMYVCYIRLKYKNDVLRRGKKETSFVHELSAGRSSVLHRYLSFYQSLRAKNTLLKCTYKLEYSIWCVCVCVCVKYRLHAFTFLTVIHLVMMFPRVDFNSTYTFARVNFTMLRPDAGDLGLQIGRPGLDQSRRTARCSLGCYLTVRIPIFNLRSSISHVRSLIRAQ